MIDIDKDTILKEWKLSTVSSPSYVLNMDLLRANLAIIDRVREQAGVDIIVALKANATWDIFPLLAKHSDGATASSLAEALLVKEQMEIKPSTYAPIYTKEDIDLLLSISSHIVFNSLSQFERYSDKAINLGVSCGLRVNPEYSTVETDLYNPCSPFSRLGIKAEELEELPKGVEGLHFHALCESRPNDLENTLNAVEEKFGKFFAQIKWLNMGGGHLMTHKDYDIDYLIQILKRFKAKYPHLKVILEPGSAFTWDTGVLVARVEDILYKAGRNIMMTNVSFACHMPDCLEMPYKPTIIGMHDPKQGEKEWWIGGNSCLAGDQYGSWSFDNEHTPQIGDLVVFRDMIHYTMVKTTMFNGVAHPSIVIYDNGEFRTIRKFSYNDYKSRMGATHE